MSKIMILILLLPVVVQAETAALLVYKVWERSVDPYITRILVTPDHVRMDEGAPNGDFTLFDRQQAIIYNVSAEDQSVLVINPGDVAVQPDQALVLSETREIDPKAPPIAGVSPVDMTLFANGEMCEQLTVAAGLMEPALVGLRELKQVLAKVQFATLVARPDELQTPCDLASNIHAPTRMLDFGLPIREQSEGRGQVLQDFAAEHDVDARLFALPEGYRQMEMSTIVSI